MTKDEAIRSAKEILKKYPKLEGYVITESIPNENGYYYDYVIFDSYPEMENFIIGIRAYDFLEFDAYLHEDEKINSVWSKSHIIIL